MKIRLLEQLPDELLRIDISRTSSGARFGTLRSDINEDGMLVINNYLIGDFSGTFMCVKSTIFPFVCA